MRGLADYARPGAGRYINSGSRSAAISDGVEPTHHQPRVQDHAGKDPGLPFDKQGIIITVETGDYMKAGKEAVNVLNEVRLDTAPGCVQAAQPAEDYRRARDSVRADRYDGGLC